MGVRLGTGLLGDTKLFVIVSDSQASDNTSSGMSSNGSVAGILGGAGDGGACGRVREVLFSCSCCKISICVFCLCTRSSLVRLRSSVSALK